MRGAKVPSAVIVLVALVTLPIWGVGRLVEERLDGSALIDALQKVGKGDPGTACWPEPRAQELFRLGAQALSGTGEIGELHVVAADDLGEAFLLTPAASDPDTAFALALMKPLGRNLVGVVEPDAWTDEAESSPGVRLTESGCEVDGSPQPSASDPWSSEAGPPGVPTTGPPATQVPSESTMARAGVDCTDIDPTFGAALEQAGFGRLFAIGRQGAIVIAWAFKVPEDGIADDAESDVDFYEYHPIMISPSGLSHVVEGSDEADTFVEVMTQADTEKTAAAELTFWQGEWVCRNTTSDWKGL